jgi:hypothetical protein
MVVDHVENDGEPQRVRAIDETFERFVIAIVVIRREQLHAVIAPVPTSRTFGDRHDFQHGDAQVFQVLELSSCGVECAFRRERADVQLVDDLAFNVDAAPVRIGPLKLIRRYDLRRTMYTLRLKA